MKRSIPILFLAAILLAGCVMKDDLVVLDDRIFRLEQRQKEMENRLSNLSGTEDRFDSKIEAVKASTSEEIQVLRSQLAEFRVQTHQLREDLQELTGRVEETEFLLRRRSEGSQQAGQRLDSRLERIDTTASENAARIRQLEQYLSLEKERTAAPAPEEEAPPEPTEAELYKRAKAAFDEGRLAEAREGFQQLLRRFPKSQEADNAQFWIGETYYREKWYEKAILEYQKVIEQYPNGNKLPSAMLKQGFAFDQLGDSNNARLIFEELVRKFPDSNEAKIAADKLGTLDG